MFKYLPQLIAVLSITFLSSTAFAQGRIDYDDPFYLSRDKPLTLGCPSPMVDDGDDVEPGEPPYLGESLAELCEGVTNALEICSELGSAIDEGPIGKAYKICCCVGFVANRTADAVGDGVEAVGDTLSDGADAVGGWVSSWF